MNRAAAAALKALETVSHADKRNPEEQKSAALDACKEGRQAFDDIEKIIR